MSTEYFTGFADALDLTEVDAAQSRIVDVPGSDQLPLGLLDDRRFEVLTYRLKCAEHGDNARVTLMQGVGERGRDVLVHNATGALAEIVQCKRLQDRMTAPSLRRELLKLALHAFLEPAILGDGPVRYELWCPPGLTEPASQLVAQWPALWSELTLRADAEEVIGGYAKFKGLAWDVVKQFVTEVFPSRVTPQCEANVDISARARACLPIYRAFFQVNVTMAENDVDAAVRRMFAEAGGYRELTDQDAKYVLDRIYSFPESQRHIFLSNFVFGLSPDLLGRLEPKEFEEFARHALSAALSILMTVTGACSRIAMETCATFRVEVRPATVSLPHIFGQTMNISAIARVNSMMPAMKELKPELQEFAGVELRAKLENVARMMWESYQRCMKGYIPSKHPPGSDEEFRRRIARAALEGTTTLEEFLAKFNAGVEQHYSELERRFAEFMALVPQQLMVVNDTQSAFENAWLLSRMTQSGELIEKARSALKPTL